MDTDFRSDVFGWQLIGRAGQALKEGRVYHPQAKVVTPQRTPRMTNANRASSKWDGNEIVLPVLWASIVPLTAAGALRAIKPAAKASTRNGTCCRHRKVNLARTEAFAWWTTKSWPTPSIALTLVIFTLRGESSKKCVHRSIRHLNSSLQLDKSHSICFIVNITVARYFFGKHRPFTCLYWIITFRDLKNTLTCLLLYFEEFVLTFHLSVCIKPFSLFIFGALLSATAHWLLP